MKRLLVFALLLGCQPRQVCFDATKVVHVLGCKADQCEVIIDDGAIIRVPLNQAIIGSTVCLDERK